VRFLTKPRSREKMARMRRPLIVAVALTIAAAACTSNGDAQPTGATGTSVNALMATSDLYIGAPQRVTFGMVLNDQRLVSFGSVDVSFVYRGSGDDEPQPGPAGIAVYVPTPGTADGAGGPTVTLPSEARGVYQVEDVTFDRAGVWEVHVTADVDGLGAISAATSFVVLDDPQYPAPGEDALATRNFTIDSDDAPPGAIDSRAANGGRIPDPELHQTTIADALRRGIPALVIFSTPVYCPSQFCGPVTEVVEDLAHRYEDRAAFIHVEIWRDHSGENRVINKAAADWLFREGDLTEPWLYLIGGDGVIVDRWATLWREDEVAAALDALPRIRT
jgi:hypothetical protein